MSSKLRKLNNDSHENHVDSDGIRVVTLVPKTKGKNQKKQKKQRYQRIQKVITGK